MSGKYDDMLFMIAQDMGSIQAILNEFFGFLKRRTDFFVLANPGDPVGFLPGHAEQLIWNIYKHHREEYNREHPFVPKPQAPKQDPKIEEKVEEIKEEPKQAEEKKIEEKSPPKPVVVDSSISTYNGAATDKYKWSQDLNDITLQIDLPKGTKSRDINVKFDAKKIFVQIKGQDPSLNGELYEVVHKERCYWTIDDGALVITLEKAKDSVWKCVILGDSEIDPKTVDTSRRVDEYDEETQMGIRKVMYEHDRKLKGLPSSDEEKAQEALKKMWDSSPYAGQPFDISKLGMIAKPPAKENQEGKIEELDE